MEPLDDKANGVPTMEVEEIVSVKDRAFCFARPKLVLLMIANGLFRIVQTPRFPPNISPI